METQIMEPQQLSEDYQRVEQAIRYLETHVEQQPELKAIAREVGLSEYHFQRLFTRWVGISPKRFLQFLTKENAKRMLNTSGNVLSAAYESGLSGPGRLHDLMVTTEAVTPGEYKQRGQGLKIAYGFHATPFGEALLGVTERGICNLTFHSLEQKEEALAELLQHWPAAELYEDRRATAGAAEAIFTLYQGAASVPLYLHLRGTNFQIKVWEALLRIPPGQVVTYGELASYLGNPGAARAVGSAVGRNPVAVLIPCHRVIRKLGEFGGYRWGTARKKALLAHEFARREEMQLLSTKDTDIQ